MAERTTLLGSASSLYRGVLCPGSAALPQVHDQENPAAVRGTHIHAWLEDEAAEIPADVHEYCRQIDRTQTAGYGAPREWLEIAFVYRGATGQVDVLGSRMSRDYGDLGPLDIPGTADVVRVGFKTLEVWDYKTGRTPVANPDKNIQLHHLALCAHRALAPHAEIIVVGLQHFKAKGRIRTLWHALTPADLDKYEQRLQDALKLAQEAVESCDARYLVPGPHCRWCRSKPYCPAVKEP